MQRLTLDKTGVIFTRKPNQQYHFKALGLGVRWGLMDGFYVLKQKKKKREDFLKLSQYTVMELPCSASCLP